LGAILLCQLIFSPVAIARPCLSQQARQVGTDREQKTKLLISVPIFFTSQGNLLLSALRPVGNWWKLHFIFSESQVLLYQNRHKLRVDLMVFTLVLAIIEFDSS
jgi:hypothetical protein